MSPRYERRQRGGGGALLLLIAAAALVVAVLAIFTDVFSGKKRLSSTVFQLSDSIVRFDVPYKEEYGDGIEYLFAFVKDGELYFEKVDLQKRRPDKELTMKWDVFRDKLRPGQEEEWRLTIKTPQGTPADAEMLATMYDASLDKIYPNRQIFYVNYSRFVPQIYWSYGYTGSVYYSCYFFHIISICPWLNIKSN